MQPESAQEACVYLCVYVRFCSSVVPRCIYLWGKTATAFNRAHSESLAGCSVALKVQLCLNMHDGTNCCFLCSSRSNTEGCFLFNLPESNIQTSTYYSGTLRRLERLQLSERRSSLLVATITCKTNKCIFCMRRTQCCIIKQTARLY